MGKPLSFSNQQYLQNHRPSFKIHSTVLILCLNLQQNICSLMNKLKRIVGLERILNKLECRRWSNFQLSWAYGGSLLSTQISSIAYVLTRGLSIREYHERNIWRKRFVLLCFPAQSLDQRNTKYCFCCRFNESERTCILCLWNIECNLNIQELIAF